MHKEGRLAATSNRRLTQLSEWSVLVLNLKLGERILASKTLREREAQNGFRHTFERLMSQVMRGLHWKRCLVYIDDILVFGNDFESALHNLELVLNRVAEYGLQLKSSKCNLFRMSVPFLGHIVGGAGLECDPNKLSAVANWIPPTTTKGVRKFLGFT